MAHAAIDVASAKPKNPNVKKNKNPKATFITAEIQAKIMGVRVSSRAKKVGVRILMRTNAGRPKANIFKAFAV